MSEPPCDVPPEGMVFPAVESPEWVDRELLAGSPADVCMWIGGPVTRRDLIRLVDERQQELSAAGLRAGGTVSLHVPPPLGSVARPLAAWRVGGPGSLLG